MKTAVILILGLLVTSCASSYRPMYLYNEVRIDNATSRALTDVALRIGDSGHSIRCDRIGANAACLKRFRKMRFPHQPIVMSWNTADGDRQIRELEPEIPAYFLTPFPLKILLEVDRDGQLSMRFWQTEPFRDSDD